MSIRFNDLPLPVRERFVQVTASPGRDPRVLQYSSSFGGIWMAYVGGVGAIIALAFILQFTLKRGQTVDPIHDKEVYLGFAAAIAVLLLSVSAIVFRFIWKPPPYPQGLYAFTSYLVKASGGDLEMMSLADVGTPTIVTVRRNGAHVHTRLELGGPFTFYFPNDAAAQASWARIAAARGTFRAMLAARDAQAIASVDPFFECTVHGAWNVPNQPPQGPRAVSVPVGIRLGRWGGAVVFGLTAAGMYYAAIDAFFEEDRAAYNLAEKKRFQRR